MKTQEMINELINNPEKEFEATNGYIKASIEEGYEKDTKLLFFRNKYSQPIGASLDKEWQEVRKPLTFTELLEEVSKNRDIKFTCKHHFYKNIIETSVSLRTFCYEIKRFYFSDEIAKILLESKFYIEN